MNNQKDIQKTGIDSIGQGSVPDLKPLACNHASKKTEKLVAALYLVSDCLETDDALKSKLRSLGIELLSDMHKLAILSPAEKENFLAVALARVGELLSLIEIAYTIGYVSEMNTTILKKEFHLLVENLRAEQKSDRHFTFKLDEKMFELPESFNSEITTGPSFQNETFLKDMSAMPAHAGHAGKRTPFNTLSFTNQKSPLVALAQKKVLNHVSNLADRQDRSAKILTLIKDLPAQAGKKDISIKDISLAFTDCSEKTIQRELNSLVAKGQLKKTGAKRWSRYSIV